MIVVAIVATLGAIAVPLYSQYIDRANVGTAIADTTSIQQAITMYQADNSFYPESLADVNMATLSDPWGTPYQYLNIQTAGGGGGHGGGHGGGGVGQFRKDRFLVPINTDYDLYSKGKNRQSVVALTASTSRDDIIRANNGGYIGLASDF
jgi:general secretion pathway protein G